MKRLLILACIALPACSSELLYEAGRNAQRNACLQQVDPGARERCLKEADMSYDEYKKAQSPARDKP